MPAESTTAQPSLSAVTAGVARVLGIDGRRLRPDTPLGLLGWDSLALLCLGDALADSGWHLDARRARSAATVADLTAACAGASHPWARA